MSKEFDGINKTCGSSVKFEKISKRVAKLKKIVCNPGN